MSPFQLKQCYPKWDSTINKYVNGHNMTGTFVQNIWKPGEAMSNGSLLCTAMDFSKLLMKVFNTSYTDPAYELLFKSQVKVEGYKNLYWAGGLGLEKSEYGNIYCQYGNDTYFQHLALFNADQRNGLVFFTNSENGLKLCEELSVRFTKYRQLELIKWINK